MGFRSLLGNQQLKDNLANALRRGRDSHFYLICGSQGSGKHTLARLLAAAMMCQQQDRPCCACPACRKVLSGVHPDVITVEDPEHKNVAVKIIRDMRDDMFIRPNEGVKKVYFLPQSLGVEGQNALLKILEEPPGYGVYILLADNPEQLLPTVRSRCVELKLQPLDRATLLSALRREFPQAEAATLESVMTRSGGYLGQARALLLEGEQNSVQTESFVRAIAQRDRLLLLKTLAPMEKWKREQLLQELQQWLQYIQEALACRAGMPAASAFAEQLAASCSPVELARIATELNRAMEYARANVSVAAICGNLTRAL